MQTKSFYFLTFSKAAAEEALTRASKEVKIPESVKKSFRTIHSLCMQLCGAKVRQMMDTNEYNAIFAKLGLPRIIRKKSHYLDATKHVNKSEKIINQYELLRLLQAPITYTDDSQYTEHEFFSFIAELKKFKKDNGKYDFVDLLEKGIEVLERGKNLQLDVLLVDEAQDLSPLQWRIIDLLIPQVKEVIIVGDDDQEIYHFAGADCTRFLQYSSEGFEVSTLNKSYRLPSEIFNLSQSLIKTVSNRYDKEFKPTENKGKIYRGLGVWQLRDLIKPNTGTWFGLARTNYLVESYKTQFLEYFPQMEGQIEFMTFHQSKGREADNVIVYTELTPRIIQKMDLDRETKLFYVAITRSKNKLYIVEPFDERGFQI